MNFEDTMIEAHAKKHFNDAIDNLCKPKAEITLPSWSECSTKVNTDSATLLETFIYDNEPANLKATERFRSQLLAVLIEARDGNKT